MPRTQRLGRLGAGGSWSSSSCSIDGVGAPHLVGSHIPRAAGPSTGATVTIRESVIRGNRTAPSVATDSDDPCCPFADSGGGGISNDGTLTLDHTRIRSNRAGAASGLTSSAIGGGILNRAFGTLTLKHSVVSDNHATVTAPNGRSADGGGIAMVGGTLTLDDSRVSDNTVDVSSAVPAGVEQAAVGGGIQVQGNAAATVRSTIITRNSVRSTHTVGEAVGFSGGLHADGPLVLRDSTISHNSVEATTATDRAEADAAAGEINTNATISNALLAGNSVTATSSAGVAHAAAGAIITAASDRMTISDSVISANRVTATTSTGSSTVHGGGIANIGVLTLRNTRVGDDSGAASGPSGDARGGGIWNGSVPHGPPSVRLALVDSALTHNALTATQASRCKGGLYTLFPVTRTNSVIADTCPTSATDADPNRRAALARATQPAAPQAGRGGPPRPGGPRPRRRGQRERARSLGVSNTSRRPLTEQRALVVRPTVVTAAWARRHEPAVGPRRPGRRARPPSCRAPCRRR